MSENIVDLGVSLAQKSRAFPIEGEMEDRVVQLIREYAGQVSLATALGVLETAKKRLLDSQ